LFANRRVNGQVDDDTMRFLCRQWISLLTNARCGNFSCSNPATPAWKLGDSFQIRAHILETS